MSYSLSIWALAVGGVMCAAAGYMLGWAAGHKDGFDYGRDLQRALHDSEGYSGPADRDRSGDE